jgi:hypothetical protein
MVLAEKGITAVERGQANTRWRDFCDLLLLSRRHAVAGDDLTISISAVAAHRQTQLTLLGEVLDGYWHRNQCQVRSRCPDI